LTFSLIRTGPPAGRRRALGLAGAMVVTVAVTAAACGSTPATPAFNDAAGAPVTCLSHQRAKPTAAYEPGAPSENTGEVLTMMRYYTANGSRDYCDGSGPSDADRRWLRGYLAAGGAPSHIARWLPALGAS